MSDESKQPPRGQLYRELARFIRLRWIAGMAVVVGAVADHLWLGLHAEWEAIAGVGLLILANNLCLRIVLRRVTRSHSTLLMFAWAQLLLDLAALTYLIMLTGGMGSPLAAFYVLHMVFSSLLLPRRIAYGGAAAAVVMLAAGLWFAGELRGQEIVLAGRALTLVLTVFLANQIVGGLRRTTRRLRRQNRQIRRITRRLRRHQRAMVQHEKMIAMGQMVAGITHEIANPLASMDSLLQLAERRPEKLNAETAKTLRDQIRRISAIISQMKEMAHPRHSEPAVTDVNQLAEQAIRMVQFDPRSKNVSISLQAGPDVGSIRMVPQAMQQVLVNLLINALDAVAEVEDRKVIVRTERRDGAVYIEVIDNGTGIPEQHLRRLFEPFFTTKPVGKGTGLGLSISYGLVEKQGGTIAVRSTPGQGATFIIKMPAGTSGGAKPARGAISRLREGPESGVAVSEKPQG